MIWLKRRAYRIEQTVLSTACWTRMNTDIE
jgi:hypothetical protein